MPQPDGSNTCCDCPARASPCDDCVTSTCPLPDGDCPHALCVEFKLDSNDTSDGELITLSGFGSSFTGFGFYFDGTDWNIFGFGGGFASLTAVDPYETWHSLVLQITDNGDGTIHVQWSVDDVPGEALDMPWDVCAIASELDIGAVFGSGAAHRTFRLVSLIGNPDIPEGDFNFPSEAFDGFVSGATIDGDGNLRIDSVDEDAYAIHYTGLKIICELGCNCCRGVAGFGFSDITEINNIDVTYDFSATYDGEGEACDAYTTSGSHTFNFVRIPFVNSYGSGYEFKLSIQGDGGDGCFLGFASNHFSPAGVRFEFTGPPADNTVYAFVLDRIAQNIIYDADCFSGTIEFCFDGGSVNSWRQVTVDPDVICGALACGVQDGMDCAITGIPWNGADFTSMRGTYSAENTCTLPHGSMHVSVTMVIT